MNEVREHMRQQAPEKNLKNREYVVCWKKKSLNLSECFKTSRIGQSLNSEITSKNHIFFVKC